MLEILRSNHYRPAIKKRQSLQPGSWIRVEKPGEKERETLEALGIDRDILDDALDPHEVPRVEQADDWIYFITRLPDVDDEFNDFTTPILFALGREHIVTISRDTLGRLWNPFIDRTLVPTTQQTKLLILMVDAIAHQYQSRITSINRQMRATTSDVQRLGSKDISALTEYERRLNDYLDALLPTNTAVEKLLGGKFLKLYEDDRDLVEDLSIDLEQLISRCKSLIRTIKNVRDSYRAVMDTRLNETIRLLTVITLALTIPTMVSGLFGMNVELPAITSSPDTFWIILVVSLTIASALSFYFLKKR